MKNDNRISTGKNKPPCVDVLDINIDVREYITSLDSVGEESITDYVIGFVA